MVKEKTKKLIASKKKAVNEVLLNTPKSLRRKITLANIKAAAAKYNLATAQVQRAYNNFLKFKKVDLRVSRIHSKRNLNFTAETMQKVHRLEKIAQKQYTKKEIKMFIFNFFFTSKLKISDYLIENQINPNQWYFWLSEAGARYNYKKYGYFKFKSMLRYAKALTKESKALSSVLPKSTKQKYKLLKNLKERDELMIRHNIKVLYYLLQK